MLTFFGWIRHRGCGAATIRAPASRRSRRVEVVSFQFSAAGVRGTAATACYVGHQANVRQPSLRPSRRDRAQDLPDRGVGLLPGGGRLERGVGAQMLAMSDLRQSTLSGLKWSGAGQVVRQSLQVAISVVLARALSPQEFGLMGMLVVFTGFANVF